jgi:hypothetical protein
VPFGWQWGKSLPGGEDVELATGPTLLVLALLITGVLAVLLILAATRSSQR